MRHDGGTTRLDPGDMLVLYSDGITEAENPSGRPFEQSGLESVLRTYSDRSVREIAEQVLAAVRKHAQDARLLDDLTVVCVRNRPAA